jgi:hypothetical protein
VAQGGSGGSNLKVFQKLDDVLVHQERCCERTGKQQVEGRTKKALLKRMVFLPKAGGCLRMFRARKRHQPARLELSWKFWSFGKQPGRQQMSSRVGRSSSGARVGICKAAVSRCSDPRELRMRRLDLWRKVDRAVRI